MARHRDVEALVEHSQKFINSIALGEIKPAAGFFVFESESDSPEHIEMLAKLDELVAKALATNSSIAPKIVALRRAIQNAVFDISSDVPHPKIDAALIDLIDAADIDSSLVSNDRPPLDSLNENQQNIIEAIANLNAKGTLATLEKIAQEAGVSRGCVTSHSPFLQASNFIKKNPGGKGFITVE